MDMISRRAEDDEKDLGSKIRLYSLKVCEGELSDMAK